MRVILFQLKLEQELGMAYYPKFVDNLFKIIYKLIMNDDIIFKFDFWFEEHLMKDITA